MGVLLDHAQDKVVLLDEDGRFRYANDATRRILGYEPDELVGEDAFDYVHPEDVADARAAFARTLASEAFAENTAEYRFRAADGSWVWLQSRMSNLTDEDLDGYVVSSRDVSDRVAAERNREETTTRLEELAATTGDVLWMFSGDWSEVLFVNPAYEDVYGRPVAELEADPGSFLETIHPDDVEAVEEAMGCLAAGNPVDMEYRVNPDEEYGVWVWVQAEPIIEDGEVVRITGFSRDVTDRRRRERQLYVMDNLLRHNLRNDLTVILGNAERIEEETEAAAERTAVIRQTGESLLATAGKQREIIDMLTSEPSVEHVAVDEVVAAAAETVRGRQPDATVAVDVEEGLVVRAVEEVGLALVELLDNAVQHAEHDRPTVRVSARRNGETVVFVVADDGPPIPAIEARVLTGDYGMNDVYHSSGLGLWLAYWAVELSDGTVTVGAGPDGNEVRVALPAVEG